MNQYNLSYQYKLEGLDNQWLSTSINKVSFASIPPGKYRLLVKACQFGGECSDAAGIDIIVLSPFYLTLWAYCLYMLAAIVLILSQAVNPMVISLSSCAIVREDVFSNDLVNNTRPS